MTNFFNIRIILLTLSAGPDLLAAVLGIASRPLLERGSKFLVCKWLSFLVVDEIGFLFACDNQCTSGLAGYVQSQFVKKWGRTDKDRLVSGKALKARKGCRIVCARYLQVIGAPYVLGAC